jgi:two-component system LytT family sensor kinase
MATDSMRTSQVVGLALLVGSFFIMQEALADVAAGHQVDVWTDVRIELVFLAAWALLTPAVLAALRRWPLDAKPAYRPLLLHAVTVVVLATAHYAITIGLRSVVLYVTTGVSVRQSLRHASINLFVWSVFTSMFFYAVVVMVYTALRFRGLYVAEQLSAARLESELTRSKLDTLRSQLRPHFLFNTLNAISVFVTEDADKAQQMILRLSTLLRRSLDEEAHEVTLRQELGFVNDYLDIQRGRFGDRLTVQLAAGAAVLDARVPVFLLQPLLENAIEYRKSDETGTWIGLSASRNGDMLHITLEDDGPGVGDHGPVREGIGLGNTRARLHHLYGSRATVELGLAHGTTGSPGTRVEIRLPFREAPG